MHEGLRERGGYRETWRVRVESDRNLMKLRCYLPERHYSEEGTKTAKAVKSVFVSQAARPRTYTYEDIGRDACMRGEHTRVCVCVYIYYTVAAVDAEPCRCTRDTMSACACTYR